MEPTQGELIEAVSQTTSSVSFKWKAPYPRGTPLLTYEIKWVKREFLDLMSRSDSWPTDEENYEIQIPQDLDRNELLKVQQSEITGLLPGDEVRLRIRAKNAVGWGEWSEHVSGE